jgi:gamma-glutamyltranspeptidase / glutathione hydrolase
MQLERASRLRMRKPRYLLFPLTLAPLALLLSACAATPPAQTAASLPQTGIVSAADPRAAEAGMAMLRQGGSATDAAIAVMLALTVVEPQSSGIGGGGFYVHANAAGAVETLDGRETAPAAATPEWFLGDNGAPRPFPEAVISGLSIGVPGNLALAAEAHARHGRLPWAALFAPAIALARDGWVLSPRGAEFLVNAKNRAAHDPEGLALFYDAAGNPHPAGTRLSNPALAETFEQIAQGGPQAFYRGPQAEAMAQEIAAATPHPAAMTAADIAGYEAKWRDPVCGRYRVYLICGMGPPSSGATTVLAVLAQLEPFDMAALGPASPVSWHLFAESQRLAYADREAYLADADFHPVPVAGLTDPAYLAARAALIAPDRRMASVSAGTPAGIAMLPPDGDEPVENGTSHFAVADSAGNVVTYTSTIEGSFGSGTMFGGFYLNNELTDFSLSPVVGGLPVVNRVEGGKRPRSSMAPTLVFGPDGNLRIAIGAAGGATIPVQVAKALIGVLDWNLTAQDAIALPGLFSPGDTITVETNSPLLAMRAELEALGHTVTARALPFKANAVEYRDGRWLGAADPRSEGVAVGQ